MVSPSVCLLALPPTPQGPSHSFPRSLPLLCEFPCVIQAGHTMDSGLCEPLTCLDSDGFNPQNQVSWSTF